MALNGAANVPEWNLRAYRILFTADRAFRRVETPEAPCA